MEYGVIMMQAAGSDTLTDVVWDGVVKEGSTFADAKISIHDNGNMSFINLDFGTFVQSPGSSKPSTDLAPYGTPLPSLPGITIAGDHALTD